MKLYEFECKQLYALAGMSIPRGKAVDKSDDVFTIAGDLGGKVVIKSQILQGGRGKAGGIKFADTPQEAARIASDLLGRDLLGEKIQSVLIEEKLSIKHELYAGITLDYDHGLPLLMFSTEGGMDIETVAEQSPESIVRMHLDPFNQPSCEDFRKILVDTNFSDPVMDKLATTLQALSKAYFNYDAFTAEINPLVIDEAGKIIAADGKLEVDASAVFRVDAVQSFRRDDPTMTKIELRAKEADLSYCEIGGGSVGIIAGGAGLGMATMDMLNLHQQGGDAKPANFLDLGGNATPEKTAAALRIVLGLPGIKGVLINVFGGINNCEQMATGISQVYDELKPDLPIVVKIRGHSQEEGWKLLESRSIPIVKFGTTEEAVALLRKEMGL